ncbi:hypothetical protein CCO03_13655 [Comamonas serinivorans]|uniref:Lysozyme inhibitor LprI-like N-terminal domain-containing protein n=1 Tax=Comamonas serinivorans TaxID=1082851 RepID=A0A1Y0ET60_9BURK|nr:hypothetical protein CCO03_13655 [Comamonas serinivorans]
MPFRSCLAPWFQPPALRQLRRRGGAPRVGALSPPHAWVLAAVGALCLAWTAPAAAQAGARCNPQGSVDEVNACSVRDFQQADTAIQVLYGDVMRIQPAHERPALRKEQTAWAREREARCRQQTAAQQARPEWPRLLHECLTRVTQERRAGLMRWMSADTPAAAP